MSIHLVPVGIENDADLDRVAREMMSAAESSPIYPQIATIAEVQKIAEMMQANGLVRNLVMPEVPWQILVVMFGREITARGSEWHLSLSSIDIKKHAPQRMADAVANRISKAFLNGALKEAPPEGVNLNLRHYRLAYVQN